MAATSQTMKAVDRRVEIAEMYLKGRRQSEIAQELGTTQATISRNLAAVREEWLKSALVNFNEAVARELAKTDNLERVYWESWERSLEPFKSKTIKARGNPKTEDELKSSAEQTLKTEDRNGDPRFLQGVQWCIEKRCKLLGLDVPDRIQIDWRETLPDGVSADEVTEQFSELMRIAAGVANDS
jgi:predicted transcriptional regulator